MEISVDRSSNLFRKKWWKWTFYCLLQESNCGGWYHYNDDFVFEVNDFIKEFRDYELPYILFYQKINH